MSMPVQPLSPPSKDVRNFLAPFPLEREDWSEGVGQRNPPYADGFFT